MKILKKYFKGMVSPYKERDVKCVVVGDTAVGKTKLIGSFIYDKPETTVAELNQIRHTSSIFTSDLSQNLKINVNNIAVNIEVWDTFGNHCSNREYSYKNADVIIICYNIADKTSFKSVFTKWINEARKFCPKTPVMLVGTQLDRRHCDPALYAPKVKKIKTLKEYLTSESATVICDDKNIELIEPETARRIATMIGASSYMEVSVVTKYGVNSLFQNAARLALKSRKPEVQEMLQKPYLPCNEAVTEIEIPNLNCDQILFKNISFDSSHTTDIMFKLSDGIVYAHSSVLMLSSSLFHHLLTLIYHAFHNKENSAAQQNERFVYEDASVTNTGKSHGNDIVTMSKDIVTMPLPRGFSTVSWNGKFLEITVKETKTDIFRQVLTFYYTGVLYEINDSYELLVNTNYLQLDLLFEYVFNTITGQTDEPLFLHQQLCSNILSQGHVLLTTGMFCDLSIATQDTILYCHKVVLANRCPVFKAMFEGGNFHESSSNQIDFRDTNVESFLAVLEYLYTGDCKYYGDLHGTLELANFLCLPRLVALCEEEIVKYITDLQDKNDDEMYTAVIGDNRPLFRPLKCVDLQEEASYNIGQFHNAPQLTAWCLHFIATNYNAFCKELTKEMKSLDTTTQKYLEEHRWPPVWYLKEQDYYEKTMKRLEQEQLLKQRKKNKRKFKTCF